MGGLLLSKNVHRQKLTTRILTSKKSEIVGGLPICRMALQWDMKKPLQREPLSPKDIAKGSRE
jgi:hypothetical protein